MHSLLQLWSAVTINNIVISFDCKFEFCWMTIRVHFIVKLFVFMIAIGHSEISNFNQLINRHHHMKDHLDSSCIVVSVSLSIA